MATSLSTQEMPYVERVLDEGFRSLPGVELI